MNKSRRNGLQRKSLRRTRRRGGAPNNNKPPAYNSTVVENWVDFNKKNYRNFNYKPNSGSFGFKRTGFSAIKQNPRNYNCLELQKLVDMSNNSKKLTNKEKTIVRQSICFPHSDAILEKSRQKVINLPDESTFKEYIKQLAAFYKRR
jgi:hypothetical protein